MIEIRIASPCDQTWTAMKGDQQVRHCLGCRKNVYNMAEMTEAEIEALVRRTEGKFCARIYRRSDGRVLTKDCPRGVARVRRRRTLAVTAAMTAFAALVWPALAPRLDATEPRHQVPREEEFTAGKVAVPETSMGIVARSKVELGDAASRNVSIGKM